MIPLNFKITYKKEKLKEIFIRTYLLMVVIVL